MVRVLPLGVSRAPFQRFRVGKKNIAWECYGDQCLVTGQKRRLIGQGGQGGGFVSEVAPSALSIDSSANVFGDW